LHRKHRRNDVLQMLLPTAITSDDVSWPGIAREDGRTPFCPGHLAEVATGVFLADIAET
jgi:hypothetical protein